MAHETPTTYPYKDFVSINGGMLRHVLLRDAKLNPKWRPDSGDRIHGGARRTYLPSPCSRIDRLLFGGTVEFEQVIFACVDAANRLMEREVQVAGWQANRVVINRIPANEVLAEHVDPTHFFGGVVVMGVGAAALKYRAGDELLTISDPRESLMHIPAGLSHKVENGPDERISVVVAHDTELASGMSAASQYARSAVRKVFSKTTL